MRNAATMAPMGTFLDQIGWTQYKANTSSTAIYPNAGSGRVHAAVYLLLGLSGETSELMQGDIYQDFSNIVGELGDVSWYLAQLCNELHITLEFDPNIPQPPEFQQLINYDPLRALVVLVGRSAEFGKKALRDKYGSKVLRSKIEPYLNAVFAALYYTAIMRGTDLGTVCSYNAKKLADRKARGALHGNGDNR